MSLSTENYSLSDVAAVVGANRSNDNGGSGLWGGGGGIIWLIVLFIFAFCWGGNGFGFGGGNGGGGAVQGALTRGDLCMDMSFQDVKNSVRNISDAVGLGFANLNSTICNQQYDTAQMINAVTAAVTGGFSALNSTICQQQYDLAGQINAMNMANMQNTNAIQTQIAGCCCDVREGISGINYNLATQSCETRNTIQNTTRDIIDNQNANARAILDKLTAQEIAAKDAQIASQTQRIFGLELAASQAAQNNYLISRLNPTPVPAYPAASPCGLGNWAPAVLAGNYGYNNGCGCCCNG